MVVLLSKHWEDYGNGDNNNCLANRWQWELLIHRWLLLLAPCPADTKSSGLCRSFECVSMWAFRYECLCEWRGLWRPARNNEESWHFLFWIRFLLHSTIFHLAFKTTNKSVFIHRKRDDEMKYSEERRKEKRRVTSQIVSRTKHIHIPFERIMRFGGRRSNCNFLLETIRRVARFSCG